MNTIFSSTITKWNKLDLSIRNSTSLNISKHRLLQFLKPLGNSCVYLSQSHSNGFNLLCYHKFKHVFLDAVDPLCSCSSAIENTVHDFFHCPNFSATRNTFLHEIAIVGRLIKTIKTKSKLFKFSFTVIQLILSMITN